MGPIRVSSNGRYFVDEKGQPSFWLGDTQWELLRQFPLEDVDAILADRQHKGFSVVQVMFTGTGDGTKANRAGHTPWIQHDPGRPNEPYFARADAVVRSALDKQLVLVLGVFHQLQATRITPANARGYARWLARRYRDAPNIIWTMYPRAEPQFVPVLRELAAGLHEGDEGAHLITAHPDPAPASSSFIHDEPWLDFNMIQTWINYELIYPMVRDDYARTPVKPVVMAEGGYEGVEGGRRQTPLQIRKQAYWSHLAGGHHSYGHDDNYTSPAAWKSWIDAPGASHLGVYRQVITSCPRWWDWVPDLSVFAGDPGSGLTLNVAARSAAGDWTLAYLASNNAARIRMDSVAAGDVVEASWIDPTTGARTSVGRFRNAGVRSFAPPAGWEDAVLLLEAKNAG